MDEYPCNVYRCAPELERQKDAIIAEFNALHIPGLHLADLNALIGSFINMDYPLPGGRTVRLFDDEKVYWGNQIERPGDARCYGVVADETHLLVCEYGDMGENPEIVLYKRRR